MDKLEHKTNRRCAWCGAAIFSDCDSFCSDDCCIAFDSYEDGVLAGMLDEIDIDEVAEKIGDTVTKQIGEFAAGRMEVNGI